MLFQHINTTVCHVTADPLYIFIAQNTDALFNASHLLAGSSGTKCVARIVDAMSRPEKLTRRSKLDIQALFDILSLKHVHDFDRPEAACFVEIDPADPVVADICLLTDGLRIALAESSLFLAGTQSVAAAA